MTVYATGDKRRGQRVYIVQCKLITSAEKANYAHAPSGGVSGHVIHFERGIIIVKLALLSVSCHFLSLAMREDAKVGHDGSVF